MSELLTPSQTVGPYFSMRLPWPEGPCVVPEGTAGAVTIYGRLYDGAGDPIPDGLIETWQADPAGRFAHPDDPRGPVPGGDKEFRGFGRSATGHDGTYQIVTLKPGALPFVDGRRATLIAVPAGENLLRFDIYMQGERETVFFDL